MFFNFSFSMTYPFESPYIRELGASPFIIGLIGGLGYLVLTAVRVPGSYIADKYGRKRVIAIMTFGVAISYIFYALAPDWRYILIGNILANLCLIYQPALEAITADSIPPDKRGVGFAMTRAIPSIPTVLSPLIAGYIVSVYSLVPGMRIIYLLTVIFSMAAAFIRLFLLKETIEEAKPINLRDMKTVYGRAIKSIIEIWRSASKTLKVLAAVAAISSFEDVVFMRFSALYVFDVTKISEFEWGIISSISRLSLLFGVFLGKVIDVIGRKKSILISYVVFFSSTVFFILSKNFIHLALIFILLTLGSMLMWPARSALTADLTPKDKRGRIMGVMGTLNFLAMIPASMIGGLLYQMSPIYPFIFILTISVINIMIVATLVKEPEIREH